MISLRRIYQQFRRYWYRYVISTNHPHGSYTDRQPVQFCGQGTIECQDTQFGYNPSPGFYNSACYVEARRGGAMIKIGSSYINNSFVCIAENGSITIGDRCTIGVHVTIMNSDFHSIKPSERFETNHKSKDVSVGNNVFIGNNVTILKGVHIGDNSVIANGSVVYKDVKDNTIVRGNPAGFYKDIYTDE